MVALLITEVAGSNRNTDRHASSLIGHLRPSWLFNDIGSCRPYQVERPRRTAQHNQIV